MTVNGFMKLIEGFREQFGGDKKVEFTLDGEILNFNEVHDGYYTNPDETVCEIMLSEN